ncbi:MAG TPA: TetR family transcriptional regulator [Polyangiaceae bacterium LLY-WYZ-15_(1-7)]|nr:TetR family transcriptional regulator [Myxococcales bacterium]MAT27218.1 TetR family transcriptional regulator [Sandaracinus sp.]HJK99950.1 TetR family transcriptional regulator [Polyangiaceae bacterium LLY-WYZ-15_(1-7)]HJL11476.1 TetR family transcriptional regulator [Polyangiaceae bacterium LLY-WYZ-15_(1-7)]HJL21515.1 TetR family transcriptional regulator [Polyangiaceae bacterium LLY-WYZ-15_(1-7)]
MGRPKGRRNEDYGASRDDLLQRVEAELLAPRGARLSFRALARAADVTPPTLRHYFGTHDGLILAVLERLRASWSAELRALARCEGPPEESLAEVIAVLCRAWGERLGAAHELGLRLGPQLSPRFLEEILEPWLQAVEARVAGHMAAGALRRGDVRHATLSFVGPVVFALVHQTALGGARSRPLDLDRFAEDHLRAFLAAHAP